MSSWEVTRIMWRPNTLAEALAAGYQATLRTRQRARLQYRCPCGSYRVPDLLVDTRGLDVGQDWACDGCWSTWERQGLSVDGEARPADRIAWKERWLRAHGAPAAVVAKQQRRRLVDPYGRNK